MAVDQISLGSHVEEADRVKSDEEVEGEWYVSQDCWD